MRLLLFVVYMLLAWFSSLDPFASADFMYTLFFAASCCIFCAMLAKQIDCMFATAFIIFQAIALVVYTLMGLSYLYFDNADTYALAVVNFYLVIADILILFGVLLGDRWLFSRTG